MIRKRTTMQQLFISYLLDQDKIKTEGILQSPKSIFQPKLAVYFKYNQDLEITLRRAAKTLANSRPSVIIMYGRIEWWMWMEGDGRVGCGLERGNERPVMLNRGNFSQPEGKFKNGNIIMNKYPYRTHYLFIHFIRQCTDHFIIFLQRI